MLFDLRSRGRRTTVRAVYLGLAILMGGGLILFGVGTGVGGGGLLNAFNGGSSNQKQVVSQAEQTALKQTQTDPNNPQAWAALLQARWTTATQAPDFNSNTGAFTTAGRNELAGAIQAWERYQQLTKNPDPSITILAARAYALSGNYAGAASAWQAETRASPNQPKGYECMAASAYAAKQTRLGDLAAAKAVSLVPPAQQTLLTRQLQQAKTQPQIAQQC